MRPLGMEGAWLVETQAFGDDRGEFQELFRGGALSDVLGYAPGVAQVNRSVSRRGVVRGVHYADVPPGQAKYVTCVGGSVLDVVVDLRVGSPTYRTWRAVRLDDPRLSVYAEAGLGHAFMALTDDATVVYLTSEEYAPQRERAVHPLDPALGIDWPAGIEPVLSEKDRTAPGLEEMERRGLLPDFGACTTFHQAMRERFAAARHPA
ncbi:dTDP-4-dehydrorhamnose 3,5-epimerase family protein [Streptomyces griseocarneus]|uniref:dTDP-4-dehydrorhamnose 3,5-epimerase family protein n=1 Tax=Streptomyces griseocarneus TaxID=51201 RepID=UPI00167CE7E7|nr:dTDP-4-dehydrorhamnose 3,5-epimerase [Streptomyces griseocarneus]MBZ6474049.1 dTDP-4-dehydrorhamnose 3,5-epimerase family protein [Streptomyces griseocarneus]GHG51828.1 dTDP-4-dehydrorhamnose 3,5-epimerase [Streptomyces griseocarneus]